MMANYKNINAIIIEFSRKFSFISEDKFLELKDQAMKLCGETKTDEELNLIFRKNLVKILRNYTRTIFESDNYVIRKNAIEAFINSNFSISVIPSENINELKIFGSELSCMNITPSEKHFSIIFSNIVFLGILERIVKCYSNVIENIGIDSFLEGKSFENARIILRQYYNLIKGDDNFQISSTKHEEKKDIYNYFDEDLFNKDKCSFEMISLPDFECFLRTRSIREIVIASLRYGGINEKQYTIGEISQFLKIKEDDIMECIDNVLLSYKTFISDIVESLIGHSKMDITGKKIYSSSIREKNHVLDYEEYLKITPLKWIAVAGLNAGCVTADPIETKDIAGFLGFNQENIISIIRNSLVGYKKYNETVINNTINNLNVDTTNNWSFKHFQKRKKT